MDLIAAGLLVATAAAVAAAVWAWHAGPFTQAGLARRLARPEFWEQALAGREDARLTVFGPVADVAMAAARDLGYDVGEPTTHAGRTTFTVRRR